MDCTSGSLTDLRRCIADSWGVEGVFVRFSLRSVTKATNSECYRERMSVSLRYDAKAIKSECYRRRMSTFSSDVIQMPPRVLYRGRTCTFPSDMI